MSFTNRSILLARTGLLIALTLMIQTVGFTQFITGPAINAILFLSVDMVGWRAGCIIGILTPVAALIRGHLPPLLAPMLPFIMMGNVILICTFAFFRSITLIKNDKIKTFSGIITAALLKTVWIWLAVRWTVPIIFGKTMPPAIATAMTLPQFITALIGGVIAWAGIKILKKRDL
ncbi:ECF transporter S component [bacterium]|nr:ECF transporter S component [bacterium]